MGANTTLKTNPYTALSQSVFSRATIKLCLDGNPPKCQTVGTQEGKRCPVQPVNKEGQLSPTHAPARQNAAAASQPNTVPSEHTQTRLWKPQALTLN